MTPLVVGEDFSKLPPSMEYIFAITTNEVPSDFVLSSIYSIDGNAN